LFLAATTVDYRWHSPSKAAGNNLLPVARAADNHLLPAAGNADATQQYGESKSYSLAAMTSRLIVKGLPKRYDESLLRDLFGTSVIVTDAKVMRTPDGRSRQFAFVGFRSERDADAARKRLNGTYVDSCQVKVEAARPVGGDGIPRAWSKYTPGSSLYAAKMAEEVVKKERVEKRKAKLVAKETVKLLKGDVIAENDAGGGEAAGKKSAKSARDDPAFKDFLDVASKRGAKPLWADSTVKGALAESKFATGKSEGKAETIQKAENAIFSDDDDAEDDDLYEVLPGGVLTENSEKKWEGQAKEAEADVESDATANDETVDDVDYFKSKVRSKIDDDDDKGDSSSTSDSESRDSESSSDGGIENVDSRERTEEKKPETLDKAEQGNDESEKRATVDRPFTKKAAEMKDIDVSETGRLFVRNLSFQVTEDDLEALFEPFGAISDIHIVQDPRSKQSRGVAFVLFVIPETAVKAMAAVDGTVFHGRLIHILPGRARPAAPGTLPLGLGSPAPGSNTFKSERDASRKECAKTGGDSAAFNAMFMSTDAVADVMAERYGVSKAAVYGTGQGESGSAAVRLAAGEARLQAETREYLLANGIDMDFAQVASRAVRRKKTSRSAFLVKNLPARTTEDVLDPVFAKYGTLDRLLVVPSGLLAVVVYVSANDAKKAYGSLAYTRMKDTPLYLEWLASEAIIGSAQNVRAESGGDKMTNEDPDGEVAVDTSASLAESVPRLSVFVKNLNFDTSDEALRKHFVKTLRRQQHLVSSIRAATVATRANTKDPTGQRLSYGYGFVEFSSPRDAEDSVKLAQSTMLDGHTLELRVASRSSDGALPTSAQQAGQKRARALSSKRKPSTKLMVRNLAFEATSRDVKQLFGTFGQVKSIRMPRKQDGTHRGFGFVEFVSKNEATAALDSLSASHLYGRHLVIDYADETVDGFASIEDMQAKAASHLAKRRRVEGGRAADGSGGVGMADAPMDDDDARMMDEMYN
jgi:multiple RNA-binding domain-containing protein 1